MRTPVRLLGTAAIATLLVFAVGCESSSISNPPSRSAYGYTKHSNNRQYRGELTEFDVLGIDPEALDASGEGFDAAAKAGNSGPSLMPGGRIMLIQSGASLPDGPMTEGLERHYRVSPFGGIPGDAAPGAAYSRAMRYAALQGGADAIVCYWGVIETSQQDNAGTVVSWLPVIGRVVPDETQGMRIRLKVAVIDPRTGTWDTFAPPPFQSEKLNAYFNRRGSNDRQIESLKQQAYTAAADMLAARYSR